MLALENDELEKFNTTKIEKTRIFQDKLKQKQEGEVKFFEKKMIQVLTEFKKNRGAETEKNCSEI